MHCSNISLDSKKGYGRRSNKPERVFTLGSVQTRKLAKKVAQFPRTLEFEDAGPEKEVLGLVLRISNTFRRLTTKAISDMMS